MKMTDQETAEVRAAVGKLAEDIKRAYASNDVELYLSAYDDGAILSMPGVPPMRGHEALKSLFENRPELPPGATFTVEPLELVPLSPEWAYAYGIDTLRFAEGETQTMTFLVVIRKTHNGWKTYREVLSADQ